MLTSRSMVLAYVLIACAWVAGRIGLPVAEDVGLGLSLVWIFFCPTEETES